VALRRAALLLLFEAATTRAHDAKARELCVGERFLNASAGLSLGAKPDLLQALGASGFKGMTCETASDVVEGTKESNASIQSAQFKAAEGDRNLTASKPARPPRKPRAPGTRWSAMLLGGGWRRVRDAGWPEAGLNRLTASRVQPCSQKH